MVVEHQLEKRNDKIYCQVCQQSWKGKPRKSCPGCPVYVSYDEGVRKYGSFIKSDHFKHKNLRLIEPQWCFKEKNNYIISYNREGATEEIFPGIELIEVGSSDALLYSSSYSRGKSFLKNSIGLKSLNLKAGCATPVYCYWDMFERDLLALYNPLDCAIDNRDLPPRSDRLEGTVDRAYLRAHNLKAENPVSCRWLRYDRTWEYRYNPSFCSIDNRDLPIVYEHQPDNLYREVDLDIFNLKVDSTVKPSGCIYKEYPYRKFINLYRLEDCSINDASLPHVYLRTVQRAKTNEKGIWISGHWRPLPLEFEPIPEDLKSAYVWQQILPLHEVKPDCPPRACYIYPQYETTASCRYEYLYSLADLELHDRDIYLSKTKLKQNYHLSPSLIKRLGKPDYYAENPISSSYPDVHQYKRSRIERFLAENAEAYAKHLAKRYLAIAIFNANSDKLAAARERKRKLKQLGFKGKKLLEQFDWNPKSDEVIEQCRKCLNCASSMASIDGFLCVINPLGLDRDRLPCPDYSNKREI